MTSRLVPRRLVSFVLGRPSDWHLRRPNFAKPRMGLHWLGPIAVVASVLGSFFAFTGVPGLSGSTVLSFWVGAGSIILMAWSFVLALRLRFLERFWGGLDSMYRAHRWAGSLAVPLMFLHTQIEPETKGAGLVAGASKSVAEAAEDLAETAELMIYGLIGISLARLIPYRWWKWTHKLFGLPFAFASWHFFTAAKPYANGSPWGIWFTSFMVAGVAAFVARVFLRDTVMQGSRYRVVAADHTDTLTRIELAPKAKKLDFTPGQFAFLRIGAQGMSEPHPLSIASAPSDDNLVFYVRHLGDWSDRLPATELVGKTVNVEGPYGRFEPLAQHHGRTVWIAGGVGLTPFLAALDTLPAVEGPKAGAATGPAGRPIVLYATRSVDGDPLVDRLRAAEAAGRIDLRLFRSPNRLTPDALDEILPGGPDAMAGCHVALCGPEALVKDMAQAARQRGARSIETEDFDIRQGFGPDRSREIDQALRQRVRAIEFRPTERFGARHQNVRSRSRSGSSRLDDL